jgi:DNA-binding MarR family transcriptional regulator
MTPKLPTAEQTFRQVPCFCGVLLIAARTVSRLYNEELRSVGLEATQYGMLTMLKHLGRMALGDLGERLAVDKTTISRNVKVLERSGWVVVERGEDGRERIASLTDSGARKLASARPAWDRAQERMRAALSSGSFETIRRELPDVALAAMKA